MVFINKNQFSLIESYRFEVFSQILLKFIISLLHQKNLLRTKPFMKQKLFFKISMQQFRKLDTTITQLN